MATEIFLNKTQQLVVRLYDEKLMNLGGLLEATRNEVIQFMMEIVREHGSNPELKWRLADTKDKLIEVSDG